MMKREYVKPIMECEAFVTNEYVAACRVVTCNDKSNHSGPKTFNYFGDAPTPDQNDDEFYVYELLGEEKWYYTGTVFQQHKDGSPHQVDITQGNFS